ncbi:hypothetical protein ES288_D11G381300v1 [Gossypium darwinii]|uniref:Uncharacterized protein n=1 Tax=Gossypium darwinii TaxID=34276 RepID=A0A5D2AUZ7_GOSDA|nr:hypothetical protein ES288_D11G381300v1 [Gossypium darwinii]
MSSTEEGGGAVGAVSTDQTIIDNNTNNDYVRIDMRFTDVPLSDGEVANLRSLDGAFYAGQPNFTAKPLIRKVPSALRRNEDFKKYFTPKVISIGPFHYDDPILIESKELKLKLAAHFVKNIGVDGESLYRNMKKEMDGLRKCYDPQELEKTGYDNEELAWMFFVDGCAILQAVYRRYGDDDDGKLFIKDDLLTFVYSDLLLLENQLPFRVLELLTRPRKNGEKFMNAIQRFIDDTVINPGEDRFWSSEWWPQQGERIHLLHLLRVRLLFNKEKPADSRFCISFTNRSDHTRTKPHHSHLFRNVNGLKNTGIWLEASETSCLADISFNSYFFVGKLRLPPITIDDSTMNLIAYEMCPDFYNNNFTVTSYMGFLDSLIDEAEDVKELRHSGILYNRLGSDKEVAKLIKKMNMVLVPSLMIYRHVKLQIHDHHKNMWIRYPAQVYRPFFRTRWTFFAFVGAIGALFIGALQAYYTIHQPK